MSKKRKPKWLLRPQSHNYPAAEEYLSLLYPCITARLLALKLREKEMVTFHAKDIFRASGLPHLGKENFHVAANLVKIDAGEKLSPILLVKDTILIIADGYHRLCSVYIRDEDLRIPCQIASVFEIEQLHPTGEDIPHRHK